MENPLGRIPSHHWHIATWSAVNAALIFVITIFFWASAAPQYHTDIDMSGEYASPQTEIRIAFDRPISRLVTPTITPAVAGNWEYEDFLISPHLSRTLVFYPEVSWAPDTEYQIVLSDVHNALTPQEPREDIRIKFRTPPVPAVGSVLPITTDLLAPGAIWSVNLTGPNDGLRAFDFVFEPETAFTAVLSEDKTTYTITPLARLQQGTEYTLNVTGKNIQYFIASGEVAYQSDPVDLFSGTWMTREAPGIAHVQPTGEDHAITSDMEITFTEQIGIDTVRAGVKIDPEVRGEWTTADEKTYRFIAEDLAYGTDYSIVFTAGMTTSHGGYLPQEAIYTFSTIGAVEVSRFSPTSGSTGVDTGSSIRVTFDQVIDHFSAEGVFSLTPEVDGTFSWEGTTMIFTPSAPFAFNTAYTVHIDRGVVSTEGLDSDREYSASFTTELSQTRLAVPFHRQERPLSCEAATLVMALRYKGIQVSESTLIEQIGYDPTPHVGNVWGNPHIAFVGDYYGRQATTGYGVYWQPISRVANLYRSSRWFTNGTVQDLTAEIKKGNPIIVWGNAASGARADWKTPDGETVIAIVGEHTRIVIGYVGSAENPTSIITLDPLSGEKYFTRSSFESNWSTLGRAGVVVE